MNGGVTRSRVLLDGLVQV